MSAGADLGRAPGAMQTHQLCRKLGESLRHAGRKAPLDVEVLPLDPAQLLHPTQELAHEGRGGFAGRAACG